MQILEIYLFFQHIPYIFITLKHKRRHENVILRIRQNATFDTNLKKKKIYYSLGKRGSCW